MSDTEYGSPRDLAAAYALGALDRTEAHAFEAWLATHPEASAEVAEFREVAALLALGQQDAPRATLRDAVVNSVRAPQRRMDVRVPPRARPWFPLALAASLLLAGWLWMGRQRVKLELAQAAALLQERTAELASREKTLSGLLAPGVELFQLTATGDPEPLVQLFWDRRQQTAILHSSNVRELPEGRTYQLWFIRDGKPVPSVTFRPGPGGTVSIEAIGVPTEGTISAAAVTEEPLGGSEQPTSPIYLVGKLDRGA
jgi:anti-sigma-K factor RskA